MTKEILETNNNKSMFTESTEIVKSCHQCYTNIFQKEILTKEKADVEQLLSQMPTLDETDQKLVGGSITLNEIKAAITAFPNGKTPGSGGPSG